MSTPCSDIIFLNFSRRLGLIFRESSHRFQASLALLPLFRSPSLDSEGIARYAGIKPQTYGLGLAKMAKAGLFAKRRLPTKTAKTQVLVPIF
jgi:hypothetical protein